MLKVDPIIVNAALAIAHADRLLITAGAGIGVDSGLPDYRGNQGFWNLHPRYAQHRLTFQDLANPIWFHQQPERAWGFYGYRYLLYNQTAPHAGFDILQKWLAKKAESSFVYTSNVDGHFHKAGFATDGIVECHGSIRYLQCVINCKGLTWPAEDLMVDVDSDHFLAVGDLPRCPDCGGLARPNILMFGDRDWVSARFDMQRYTFHLWREQAVKSNLVVIEIGAGLSIGGIRSLSQSLPGPLIRINPRDSEGPEGTLSISKPALGTLIAIDQVIDLLEIS